jgi:hypothetical protein
MKRGVCSNHFKNKIPTDKESLKKLELKIKENVTKDKNGCLVWNGYKDKNGYGKTTIASRSVAVHRIVYAINYDDFDQSLLICHKCDNPACCKPSHLFMGTHKDNERDKIKKGRRNNLNGSKHPFSKINEKMVNEIRSRYKSGAKLTELSDEFNLTQGHVHKIVKGISWKHLLTQRRGSAC